MKQIWIEKPGDICVRDAQRPVPGPGEALLKILYGGICGSDLGTYRGTMAYSSYPRTPGHEFSAEIVEVLPNDRGLEKGMVVTANPYFNCGECYSCERGLVNCCADNQTMGVQREGAFAEYISMPIERIYPGQGLSPKTLTLIEPFCISYHGVKRANIKPGEKVLVIGAGTIGVLAAMAAMQFGAEVTIADVAAPKLEFAQKIANVHHTILNDSSRAVEEGTREVTGENGFDVTIECVGLPSTFQDCINAAAFGARVVVIGIGKQNLDFAFSVIQKKELTLLGSRNAVQEDFQEAIALVLAGKADLDGIVTDSYPLEQAVSAFRDFDQNGDSMLKVLIDFTQ